MTPELLAQRRWERIAEMIEIITTGVTIPVVMSHSEGGGILIIFDHCAFHFFNIGAVVHVDVSAADAAEYIESRRNCFRFDLPLEATVKKVCGEIII